MPGIAAAWAAVVGSVAAAPADGHVHFQRFMPRDGLPAAVVYCGMQDSRGFLWFGTADGVARFDGRDFRVFHPDPADPESLANGAVLGIEEDADGNLWMATEGGLDLWHRDTERFSHFRHGDPEAGLLADDTNQCLLREPDGRLWVGTRRGGLHQFDPRKRDCVRRLLPGDPWVRCLLRDRRGALWIGTGEGGLARLDPGAEEFHLYRPNPDDPAALPSGRTFALAEDGEGGIWIGTDRGFCRLDPASGRFRRYPVLGDDGQPLPSQTVSALVVDGGGVLWVGTDGGGLSRFDPAKGAFTEHRRSRYAANTLAADAVRALFQDRSGDLWIGHFPAGISHFDRSAAAFQVFVSVPGDANTLSDDQVLAFWEDPGGDLWVGTDNGGLNHWSAADARWSSHGFDPRRRDGLSAKAAVAVRRDHQGILWVGTWDGGLNRFDPATGGFRHYRPDPDDPHSLSDPHAWALAETPDGALWVGTIGGGVNRYDRETDGFEHFRFDRRNPHSLNDDIVSCLHVGRDGTLWAGTPKGLARFEPQTRTWRRFQTAPGEPGSLNGYWIFDLTEDREGNLWVTTEGGGLNRLDPRTGRCESFRTSSGLPSDMLRGILADADGALWIGSNRGLVRFDPASGNVRVFDESNGLPGGQFNPHARLRLGTGEMLFGCTQGFVRFNPRALPVDRQPPPVVLTNLEIFGRVVPPGTPGSPLARSIGETRELVLPWRYSVIGFQFAALSYRSVARTQYRLKLEGFDRDWRAVPQGRRTTFTNLDPGRYTLRIKAANGDGVWNPEGVSLRLVIVPPWWRTPWFKGGALIFLVGTTTAVGWAVSAARAREGQRQRELALERERAEERARAAADLQALNQELEVRVANRTAQLSTALKELEAFSYSVSHDLRAPLRSLDGFSRVLLEDYQDKLDEEGRDSLARIRAGSQRMGQLIDDLLNLARVSRDELVRSQVDLSALAAKVAKELKEEFPGQRMEFAIQPGLVANGDARLLEVVLQNLLGNACKFSGKREVARIEVGCAVRDGLPAFFVRDNGAGFDMNYAQKLFGAFQRFHASSEFPGTGIGLATVQRIIHRHGGTVSAQSQPDAGATFYFTLPDPTKPQP